MFYLFCSDCKGILDGLVWGGGMVFEECWPDFVACLGFSFVYAGLITSKNGIDSVCSGSKFVFHNITIESAPPVAK